MANAVRPTFVVGAPPVLKLDQVSPVVVDLYIRFPQTARNMVAGEEGLITKSVTWPDFVCFQVLPPSIDLKNP